PAYGDPRAAPAAAAQAPLWTPAPRGFASLRFIGQIFDGYLLCQGEGRVVLIDQHAAHERVVFERLRAECRAGGVARDRLLVPETIALPAAESAALAEHAAALAAAGLEGEPFGEGTFLLRTVPRLLGGRDVGALLRAVAGELVEEGASAAAERATDAALATIACHGVVRVGQRLGEAEAQALLASMDGVEVSAHCPHGRPSPPSSPERSWRPCFGDEAREDSINNATPGEAGAERRRAGRRGLGASVERSPRSGRA